MSIFKKIFRRKPHGNDPKAEAVPQPLRIEGIPEAPFTPEPDDAELAAQAVLEMMAAMPQKKSRRNKGNKGNPDLADGKDVSAISAGQKENVADRDVKYYQKLAERIREAHQKSARQATRFIYNCELELQKPRLPLYGSGSVQLLETELYKRLDVVEREGGELKRRWQHCLAEVTVRLMNSTPPEEENGTQKT